MMPSHHWARNFTVEDNDIEYLTNLLLERETPLDSETLARALIEQRIEEEVTILRERYKDAHLYNPGHLYQIGQKLIFSEFDYETGEVVAIRAGANPDYGVFNVIAVQFDDSDLNTARKYREFASELTIPHELSATENDDAALSQNDLSLDTVMEEAGDEIVAKVEERLREEKSLIHMARKWFPRDLLMDVNVGHLNLAEAVLDINGGGPMYTTTILDEIGGLGKAPLELQTFSMNYALNNDSRFDEVGPSGEVLWYLNRLEPQEVLHTPPLLRYTPIEYDRKMLSQEMIALEAEIGDEHSTNDNASLSNGEAVVTINYPHRRLGTLPLNAKTEAVIPTARQTPRVCFTLVDGQDGEEYQAWAVRKDKYVYGVGKFYRKHKLPVGAHISVRNGDEPGQVIIDFKAYKPRTEWIRLIVPKNDQIAFENQKRAIGAEYDELMILGADDLAAVDSLTTQLQKKSLVSILRSMIPTLGGLTPQGTVHAKTLYSAVNIVRRCPPGPLFATLAANPDFQNVGGHYWKLSGE